MKPHHCMTPAEKIAKNLELYHDGKFGFAVYRVDYNDDEKWSEFKQRLAEYAAAGIIDDEHGDLICDQWTFDFMEDENRFTGASTNEIRRHFLQWLKSIGDYQARFTRYRHSICADAEVIDSIVNGEDPSSERSYYHHKSTAAFVKLISTTWREVPFQQTPEEEPDDKERAKINAGDEGFPPIDGCRRYDVGWMKVAARFLFPMNYVALSNEGWYDVYQRPPEMLIY